MLKNWKKVFKEIEKLKEIGPILTDFDFSMKFEFYDKTFNFLTKFYFVFINFFKILYFMKKKIYEEILNFMKKNLIFEEILYIFKKLYILWGIFYLQRYFEFG